MRASSRIVLILACSLAIPGWAEEKSAKLKVQGRLGLGAESTALQGKVENLFETRIGIKTKKIENTRAYLEVRADEGSRDVSIQDLFFDYRSDDQRSRVRAGQGKKIIGWEYDLSNSERLSLRRSLTYQYLEDRSVVGRDYFLQYQWRNSDLETESETTADSDLDTAVVDRNALIDPAEKVRLALAFHSTESKDMALIASAIATLTDRFRLGAWAAVHGARNSFHRTDHPQFALSALFQSGIHRGAAEAFMGGDPQRTEMERFYGGGRRVRYAALKGEYALMILRQWSPYWVHTTLYRDLGQGGDRSQEDVLGLRLYVGNYLQIAGEFRRNENRSETDPASVPHRYDTAGVLARYYF